MTFHRQRWLVAALAVAVVSFLAWDGYWRYRRAKFFEETMLVGFSTSLIGMPSPEKEREFREAATALRVDWLAEYLQRADSTLYDRFDLAWVLISDESPDYFQYAKEHVAEVPWPEVRIWRVRRNDPALSATAQAELLKLVLASPTSEGKLGAAGWLAKQGDATGAEDAYFAAMNSNFFWDALDAADRLVASERYRHQAIKHLLAAVREEEIFVDRAANSLLTIYDVHATLDPLVEACRKERPAGKQRQALIEKLTELVENDLATTNAPPE